MMSASRQDILDTALELFLQKSFKEITMKELEQNTVIFKGTFYHYFTSKEQFFEKVVWSFFLIQ